MRLFPVLPPVTGASSGPPLPPIELVASTIKAATSGGATTDAVNTTGATLLVVSSSWYKATTVTPTITDSKSNNWTKLTTRTSGDQSIAVWYCVPTSVGSGHTVTLSGTSVFSPVAFSAFSGADATPYVQEDYLLGGGTSMQHEIDPDSPNALVIVAINTVTNTSTLSIDESFAAQGLAFSSGASIAHAQAYRVLSDQSTTSPTWSWTGSVTAIGVCVVFAKANTSKRVTTAVTSTNAYFSPYGWYSDGSASLQSNNIKSDATYAISANPGNYIKTKFSGTSLRLKVDIAALRAASLSASQFPALEVSIDGGAWVRKPLSAITDTVTLASGLTNTIHTARIVFAGCSATLSGRFTTPINALKVTGFKLDSGESLSAPTLQSNRAILYGDSISEGYKVLGSGNTVADQNAQKAWTTLIGEALSAEFGVVGFASQGYTVAVSEIPDLEDAWDFYSDAKSRLVSAALPSCNYIVSGHGTNDYNTSATQAAVTALIGQWRAAAPSAKIFVLAPPNQNLKASISAGVTAAADGSTYYIDSNTNHAAGNTTDGVHLNTTGQSNYATASFTLMQPNL